MLYRTFGTMTKAQARRGGWRLNPGGLGSVAHFWYGFPIAYKACWRRPWKGGVTRSELGDRPPIGTTLCAWCLKAVPS